MASLDDGLTAGTTDAAGAAIAAGTADNAGATGSTTGVAGAGAGRKAAAGAGATANDGADTATVVASTGSGSSGDPGATETSTSMAAIVRTTNTGTACTTGTASQEEDTDETQASISLHAPKANLAKEINKTPLYKKCRLAAQLHTFLLQDSPNLTQINDAENKPAVGIINIPISSTIRVLHSFVVGTNPIGGSYPISGNILSLVGNGSYDSPPQAMVLPREVFHKTSIWIPDQDYFEHKLNNTQAFPLKKNANLTHEAIILKIMPISAFRVYDGFDAELDTITIYRRIKNLPDLSELDFQELLTFLRDCMTSRLVNDTGNFIPSSVFMDSTPPAARTWGINKFNINFTTICSSHQEPGPASALPVA